MRAAHPSLYETEVAKWEAGEPALVDPLSRELERDLLAIQVAEVLHVPAPAVGRLPLHWADAALTLLEARQLMQEQNAPDGGDA